MPATAELSGFPEPLWGALLGVIVSGALGAFAADLVTDAGRIERVRREETGWALGFIGKMVVGSVAALVLLTLNPPGESWLTLIGTALAAGVGGEAILLAIVSARRTQQAENERDVAEDKAARIAHDAVEKIESFRVLVTTAAEGHDFHGHADLAPGRPAGMDSLPASSSAGQFRGLLDTFAERSTTEILASARSERTGSITAAVRAILVRVLNHHDVDTRKLKDLGGADPGIRRRIAHEIAQTWPNLNPPFMEEHVTADSTLSTLSRDVRRRTR
ncbi:DUF4257 domain-containing protein [Longimicrobium terrae]|uniref:Putative membrane protein YeaQ/YmgE (Transglycosylase-associated protein family) n=1 Tax=Longimicrobium terrae TaxID=1639882 RepID=A0A841H1P5_9BACT|nr:hypothetical protein [Longimicrobium terrae]MBB6071894.1 putative membrane protein YeaQ/YmgE (transglycosylase-associated protein family) [Longimicrobium terrae]NNC30444.1 DUF4257 domain-containing protein [Longimicrobium terrae]